MEKQTVIVLPRITPFHLALGFSVILVGVSYCLYTGNKANFKTFRYEMVDGRPILVDDMEKVEDKKKTIKEPSQNDDKPIVSLGGVGGKEKETTPTPSVEKSDIKPAIMPQLQAITPSVREAFFTKYAKVAISEMNRTGVPASITMAQAAIEGRFGTSSLVGKAKNHFGIKCFSKTCPKGHCINKTDDTHKDFFKTYKTDEGSFVDHSDFLVRNGYKKACNGSKDYKVWSGVLQQKGYATDGKYGQTIVQIVQTYGLDKFDKLSNL